MANQQQKTRLTKQTPSDDEIDLFELLHFLIKGTRYWLSGGLVLGFLAIIYALTLYPSSYQQQTINDIELDQESLSMVRQVMPAMTVPLEGKMQTQGLESLFNRITKGGANFLDETIFGASGVDLEDKSLDSQTKGKIETVFLVLKASDQEQVKREINFIRNNIRGVSQYLAVKKYLDNEIINARIDLFNSQAEVNRQQLKYERATRQLLAYQDLENESYEVKDMQIILNLTNKEEKLDDRIKLNTITEFAGAKYMPLGNRIIALKSEMADLLEAIKISQLQIEALMLSQKLLYELADNFTETPYQGDVIDFAPMMQLVQDYRQQKTSYTREEIAALDNFERQLIAFDRSGFRFSNNLPMVVEKKGRLFLVLIGGFIGAFFGFLWYAIKSLANTYSRRYLK